jgi:hypothetical protein
MYQEIYKMYECCCETQQCCDYAQKQRYFLSKDEEIENLKKYKKELEKEIKGVDEKIHDMTM